MSFPSDYKRVQQPGGTIGVQGVDTGLPRQLQVETTNMILKLMDGSTPGGLPVVMKHMLDDYLQDGSVIGQGTKAMVENGTDGLTPEQARLWTASVLLSVFQKLANTATAGSWFIKNGAMPETFRDTSKEVTDFNSIGVAGLYMADPSVVLNAPLDMPTGNTTRVMLLCMAQSPDNLIQILYARDNTAKYWSRVKKDTVWQPWFLASGITAADLVPYFKRDGSVKATGVWDLDGYGEINLGRVNLGFVGDDSNYIINGDFAIAQRALSQTASGYFSIDRWWGGNVGTTKTMSYQTHTLGQTQVPGNPAAFMRHVVATVAGAGNFCKVEQRIEDVRRLAGKKVTATIWAKADAVKDIALGFDQVFGTGGSPSATVKAGNVRKTLGTGWARLDWVFDLPSIAGKTIGSADNSYTTFSIWFDAGSSFNAETSNLGQQSGTFEISHVSIREGDRTKEADPYPFEQPEVFLERVKRFYQKIDTVYLSGWNGTGGSVTEAIVFPTPMRAFPSTVIQNVSNVSNLTTVIVPISTPTSANLAATIVGTGFGLLTCSLAIDAEI